MVKGMCAVGVHGCRHVMKHYHPCNICLFEHLTLNGLGCHSYRRWEPQAGGCWTT